MPFTFALTSKPIRSARRTAPCAVLIACIASTCAAQQGPVFPTRQDFPDPSNANKPVFPKDSLGGASDTIDGPIQFPDAAPELPVPRRGPEVFEPPSGAIENSDSPPRLDFGTPRRPQRQDRSNAGTRTTDYNVGIAITETLLNQLAADVRREANSVCDRVLGTPVTGTQTTNATTRIDCRQNYKTAQVNVVLESLTNSTTLGRRPNALISTEGCHRADLTKPVYFDGQKLTTRRPQGFVKANNLNRGIVTSFTGVPLLGPVANRIAQTQALRSQSASETETAEILTSRVVPQFNQSVDGKLSDANSRLRNQIQPWLRDKNLWPADLATSTTDDEMRIRARFGGESPVAVPGRRLFGRYGSVLLHQTAVNEYLSRLNINGMRISDRQLKQMLSGLTAQDGEVANDGVEDPTKPSLYSLVLAEQDPVTVRFDEDDSEVVLRVSIEPIVGEMIAMQEIHLPIFAKIEAGSLAIDFGIPRVVPADGSEPGMASELIGKQIATLTKAVTLPNEREFTLSETKKLTVKISEIGSTNGWLLLAVD